MMAKLSSSCHGNNRLTVIQCRRGPRALLFPFMKTPFLVVLLLAFLSGIARSDEFADMSAGFGTTLTLAGVHHATTSNPDGSAINFWTNSSEGAVASTAPGREETVYSGLGPNSYPCIRS